MISALLGAIFKSAIIKKKRGSSHKLCGSKWLYICILSNLYFFKTLKKLCNLIEQIKSFKPTSDNLFEKSALILEFYVVFSLSLILIDN